MSSDYARAEGGNRAHDSRPCNPGCKYSIIGAISVIGIVAVLYLELAVNTNIFLSFIKNLLVPKLRPGMYVIFDNVGFHKSDEIKEQIESTGARVVFLPPYSPDLSPIEKLWSKVKNILKKLMPRTKAEFHQALAESLDAVTSEDCEEWFESCGYTI